MNPIRFAIIGGGWRTLFFLRIARALPDRFQITGLMVRDPEKGALLEKEWGIPTFRTLNETLAAKPCFVVVSVPWAVTPVLLKELADLAVPTLAETPPAPDIEGLLALWPLVKAGARIQVAEQYNFQPIHAARLAVVKSGKLGAVTQAQVSAAHGYHGISIMRALLGVGLQAPTITARHFTSPLVNGPGRDGPPNEENVGQSGQELAWFDYGDKLGVFDFTGDQYFSWVRSPRILVRGERGEINNTTVRWLADCRTPITVELQRQDAGQDGNLEGYYHKGILAGGEWVYRNPFVPGRLADDEIAIATCLQKMAEYADGGPDFYNLADASQDHYLGIMLDLAAAAQAPLHTELQPWALA